MKALEFPLSNDFFLCDEARFYRDNTSHGRKGGFVTVKLSNLLHGSTTNDTLT